MKITQKFKDALTRQANKVQLFVLHFTGDDLTNIDHVPSELGSVVKITDIPRVSCLL